jgi:hypothetical protein
VSANSYTTSRDLTSCQSQRRQRETESHSPLLRQRLSDPRLPVRVLRTAGTSGVALALRRQIAWRHMMIGIVHIAAERAERVDARCASSRFTVTSTGSGFRAAVVMHEIVEALETQFGRYTETRVR